MPDETTTREKGALTAEGVDGFRRNFEADPSKQLMQNAVALHDVNDVALNRSIVTQATHTFSTVLDDLRAKLALENEDDSSLVSRLSS